MRIRILCQNRVGILRDMLNLLVDYGINVARGEVGGEQGNAIYLHCPNLMNLQLQALRPKIEALPGVFELRKVSLMPSERHSLELNALLGALDFPALSVDMSGAIVAANRCAAQLLGVRVDEVPGLSLSRYAEDFDLPELVRANKARINGLRVQIKGQVFLADIAPLQSQHDDSEALAGAVLTLHRADQVGERIYNVRKQELRGFDSIFQSSKMMAAVVREARRMAPLDAPLLIEGETGTGKELLARACHLSSPRGQAPFMALNCAGLPESMAETELFGYGPGAFEGARPEGKLGLLELTAGGTLFLDGVGEMSARLQAKLLRFLQDGGFRRVGSDEEVYLDVRVICATQVDLSELCAKGEFRQDLYHRLNVLSLHIPPLRECLDGLEPLALHFIDQASRQIGCRLPTLSAAALARLGGYHWPGNVRQLENTLFQAVSLCDDERIEPEHIRLPAYGAAQPLGDFALDGDLASSGASRRPCWKASISNSIPAAGCWASGWAYRTPPLPTSCASTALVGRTEARAGQTPRWGLRQRWQFKCAGCVWALVSSRTCKVTGWSISSRCLSVCNGVTGFAKPAPTKSLALVCRSRLPKTRRGLRRDWLSWRTQDQTPIKTGRQPWLPRTGHSPEWFAPPGRAIALIRSTTRPALTRHRRRAAVSGSFRCSSLVSPRWSRRCLCWGCRPPAPRSRSSSSSPTWWRTIRPRARGRCCSSSWSSNVWPAR
ncbi:Anaerobic nitric oxide reductase transcription regulator NorR [Stutzerimonas stutzeri]